MFKGPNTQNHSLNRDEEMHTCCPDARTVVQTVNPIDSESGGYPVWGLSHRPHPPPLVQGTSLCSVGLTRFKKDSGLWKTALYTSGRGWRKKNVTVSHGNFAVGTHWAVTLVHWPVFQICSFKQSLVPSRASCDIRLHTRALHSMSIWSHSS